MKFGITQDFPCSYLDEQRERLLMLIEPEPDNQLYTQLMQVGFRRSGDQLYRPHCDNCSACKSLRVNVNLFEPDKHQRRVINKNNDLSVVVQRTEQADYYPLYETYINTRHQQGSMYPANRAQFASFLGHGFENQCFIELRLEDRLIAVAITDELQDGLSAVYTFFDPDMTGRSLGSASILFQIQITRALGLPYLYLGYQIDDCSKMNYKAKFLPHEQFFNDKWVEFTKKHA